jgi:DNA-binding Lrp family transcriptional regulator
VSECNFGWTPSTASLRTPRCTPRRIHRTWLREARGLPEIRALHTTNGTWDLIAEIGVDTLPDLDRVLGTIRAIDGIRGSETSILLTSM